MDSTAAIWVAAITAIPPTLVALTALLVAVRSSGQVGRLDERTNGLMEKVAAAARQVGYSEGREAEAAQRRAEVFKGRPVPPGDRPAV